MELEWKYTSLSRMQRIIRTSLICLFILAALSCRLHAGGDSGSEDYLITISTDFGEMKAILYEDTPMHKENFIALAKAGVYDGVAFHRVIDNFMIQTGDPNTRNQPLSGEMQSVIQQFVPAEIKPSHKHVFGAIGAARRGNNVNPYKNSSATQFYIVENCEGAPHLDGEYTVFGKVMSGHEVITKIASVKTGQNDKPLENIRMEVRVEKVNKKDIAKFYNYTY